jgi:hypothetical protein
MDFIGIGAQKSGTSWVYACLYEHPEICAPIKEIHFFSRPRFEKGREWYESHFKKCGNMQKKGEFSTSYLYSPDAPQRIKEYYPEVKLIAILRNPVTRAYSQYRNAIKAGEISETLTFDEYQVQEESVIAQGRYAEQIERYTDHFSEQQMLVLVYEDIEKDPLAFMKHIYAFLGVDVSFVPSMLNTSINVARTPKRVFVERVMHHISEFLRKIGFDKFVWIIRKLGIPDFVRSLNTKKAKESTQSTYNREALKSLFRRDAEALTKYCGRDMVKEWDLA